MGTASTVNSLDHFIETARKHPVLTREEEHELAVRSAAGDRGARDRLLAASLRHVVAVALRYRHYGTPVSDLVSEGNIGLCIAAGKFDPSRGTRFITYAGHWIRAYVLEAVLRHRTMVGGGSGALRSKMFFRLQRERSRLLGVVADADERRTILAARFGVTEARVDELLAHLDARDVSIDGPTGTEGDTPLVERLEGASEDAESVVAAQQQRAALANAVATALSTLDPRERRIVLDRAMGDDSSTLADLGRELGVSRERARQLEERAHGKLRRHLSAFVDAAA